MFLKILKAWLREYFKGNYPEIKVPLAPKGTDFQQKVWNELQTIRYRELKTYGEIAKTVGRAMNKPAMSAQAVGGAVGVILFLYLYHVIEWLVKMEI